MKNVLYYIIAGFFLQGCFSTPKFLGQANQNQKLITNETASKVLSVQSHTAAIEVDKFINGVFDKPAFKIVVANQYATPLMISSKDIQVFADGQLVALLDPKTVMADRIRTAKHLESRAGNRGSRNVNRGPDSGNLPTSLGRNSANSASNQSITTSYRYFISTQLDQATVAPNQIYVGYVTLDVESLESVQDIKVVLTVDSEEHVFTIVRS